MAFGAPENTISKNTRSSCQVIDQVNWLGQIIKQYTYNAIIEVDVETYADEALNEAKNAQTGNSVITTDNFIETANDYARRTYTTRTINVNT